MATVRKVPAVCQPGKVVEYNYDTATFQVTDEMKEVFDWDGGFIVKGIFSQEEIAKVNHQLEVNQEFNERAFELLGGGEVYHYHTKLMMKQPRTGGSHLWHQDYGYWYKNGLLTPDVMTAYIALDKCVKENGCLQVVLGTHRCGRIDHNLVAGQTVADQTRVDELLTHYHKVYVHMDPGDCLFFHSNLLHTADKNDSDMRRWTFLCSYNTRANNPVYEHHHPQYTPLDIVPDDALMKCTNLMDLSGKDFMDPASDKTIQSDLKKSGYH